MNIQTLRSKLQKKNIPLHLWGGGTAKSIEKLCSEVNAKVTTLEFRDDGSVLRKTLKVQSDIFWQTEDGLLLHLKEAFQIFPNGGVRDRSQGRSMSEKHPKAERPVSAMVRGMREELGIHINRRHLMLTATYESSIKPADAYPGICTQALVTHFVYFIRKKHYRPSYRELKDGRETIFIWRPFTGFIEGR